VPRYPKADKADKGHRVGELDAVRNITIRIDMPMIPAVISSMPPPKTSFICEIEQYHWMSSEGKPRRLGSRVV